MGVKCLGKIKIHEIAKKLDLNSKEVIEVAKKLKIDVKSHLSGVDEDQAKIIEKELSKKVKKHTEKKEKVKKDSEEKKEEKAPVIIRREVIISEDEQEKKKQETKKKEKKSNVGFVERKQNNDYNIVYRNKPNKPMTVSELFGLKTDNKKDKKIEEEHKEESENLKK